METRYPIQIGERQVCSCESAAQFRPLRGVTEPLDCSDSALLGTVKSRNNAPPRSFASIITGKEEHQETICDRFGSAGGICRGNCNDSVRSGVQHRSG